MCRFFNKMFNSFSTEVVRPYGIFSLSCWVALKFPLELALEDYVYYLTFLSNKPQNALHKLQTFTN